MKLKAADRICSATQQKNLFYSMYVPTFSVTTISMFKICGRWLKFISIKWKFRSICGRCARFPKYQKPFHFLNTWRTYFKKELSTHSCMFCLLLADMCSVCCIVFRWKALTFQDGGFTFGWSKYSLRQISCDS